VNPRSLTFAAALLAATLAAPTAAHAANHRICVRGDLDGFIIDADPYDYSLLSPPPMNPGSWNGGAGLGSTSLWDEVAETYVSDEVARRDDLWRLGGLYIEVYDPATGTRALPLGPLSTTGGPSNSSYGCTPYFNHTSSILNVNALTVFYSAQENVFFYSTICTRTGAGACGIPVIEQTVNLSGPNGSTHHLVLNGAGTTYSATDALGTLLMGTIHVRLAERFPGASHPNTGMSQPYSSAGPTIAILKSFQASGPGTLSQWCDDGNVYDADCGPPGDVTAGAALATVRYARDAARLKWTMGHEFGHIVTLWLRVADNARWRSPNHFFSYDYPSSGFSGSHDFLSLEWTSAAAMEGFAHWVAVTAWNADDAGRSQHFYVASDGTRYVARINSSSRCNSDLACGKGRGYAIDWLRALYWWTRGTVARPTEAQVINLYANAAARVPPWIASGNSSGSLDAVGMAVQSTIGGLAALSWIVVANTYGLVQP